MFIPGFHSCGTLLVVSVNGITIAELQELSALKTEWDGVPSKVIESNALEGTVLSWAKGWRSSCGRGEAMKEVRVAKLNVGEEEEELAVATADKLQQLSEYLL